MFIRKKVYEEKMDLLNGYIQRCERKNDEIFKLKVENGNLQELNEILQERIDVLGNGYNTLVRENEKLVNWIEKIINEVGCYKVSERNSIVIPVVKNEYEPAYGRPDEPFANRGKTITIPEIKICKMG